MRSTFSCLSTLAMLALAGCGAEARPRGFTDCGDFPSDPVQCQPGQYCRDATFSDCVPGCTSDFNCADGQTCIKAPGESVGDCVNGSVPTPPVDGGPPPVQADGGPLPSTMIEACRDACQRASLFCSDDSITPTQVSACDSWCRASGTTDPQRETFIACVDAAFFTSEVCDEQQCLP